MVDRTGGDQPAIDQLDATAVMAAFAIAADVPVVSRRFLDENAAVEQSVELLPQERLCQSSPQDRRFAGLTLPQQQIVQSLGH